MQLPCDVFLWKGKEGAWVWGGGDSEGRIRRGVDGKKGMKNKSGMIRMIAIDKDEWMIRIANGMGSFAIGMTKMGWIPI